MKLRFVSFFYHLNSIQKLLDRLICFLLLYVLIDFSKNKKVFLKDQLFTTRSQSFMQYELANTDPAFDNET